MKMARLLAVVGVAAVLAANTGCMMSAAMVRNYQAIDSRAVREPGQVLRAAPDGNGSAQAGIDLLATVDVLRSGWLTDWWDAAKANPGKATLSVLGDTAIIGGTLWAGSQLLKSSDSGDDSSAAATTTPQPSSGHDTAGRDSISVEVGNNTGHHDQSGQRQRLNPMKGAMKRVERKYGWLRDLPSQVPWFDHEGCCGRPERRT